MKKTYFAKKQEIKRTWYLVDAKDKILGRLASKVAAVLRGKHKPMFTPHLDSGDNIVVINASKVRLTGRKAQQKVYRRYSGYPGGLREVSFEVMFSRKPATVVHLAIRRMLPGGRLGSKILKKLKIYADDKHLHAGQKLVPLEV
ncbi:MAG: 50S ribosomal protein L13 [Candidatus Omnitrophica bacterium]|jgi:large subunit ribosomal protein L13|nr:50S ribosomal protein L13 [Candidatus Omnitrophota bacterium]